ncbi:aldolase [Aspergillus karnatakaensis]|uniref:aldolase n=1 Tax=Aspergillus karnatakaensis TaxID=1810916 RepID=UPI003CCD2EE2
MTTICAGGQSLQSKYGGRAPPEIHLPERQWPSKKLTKSPIWLSTDLRDGNQALPNPMTTAQKWQMFRLLVDIGFKQIEVSFPCASETEYNFTRELVETPDAVPDDVSLEVMTPCRKETLLRAVESVKGAKKAILFTYLATSDNYRETILQRSEQETLRHVRECIEYARSITKDDPTGHTEWTLGFGMEDFANARPDVALRLAEVIQTAWQPSKQKPVILGLASSVEAATVNIFADQVEYFSRHLQSRDTVCISIHTHNDRGGAAAAAELACLAGGDRVEGCLFGNGERAGNLDLVTAAMNVYTQGIDTGMNFGNLPDIRRVYEEITQLPVHPRTPYSGDYYFRAFSGSHQDAIRKGLQKRAADPTRGPWQVPYLPLDPADLGVSFDSVIGVNSQSGKGGVAWLIQKGLGLSIPTELAASFSVVVKERSVALERGLAAEEICALFADRYDLRHSPSGQVVREKVRITAFENPGCSLELEDITALTARAAAIVTRGMGVLLQCTLAASHLFPGPAEANLTVVYVRCAMSGTKEEAWGVGIGFSQDSAIDRALLSVINRYHQSKPPLCPRISDNPISPLELVPSG